MKKPRARGRAAEISDDAGQDRDRVSDPGPAVYSAATE